MHDAPVAGVELDAADVGALRRPGSGIAKMRNASVGSRLQHERLGRVSQSRSGCAEQPAIGYAWQRRRACCALPRGAPAPTHASMSAISRFGQAAAARRNGPMSGSTFHGGMKRLRVTCAICCARRRTSS